MYLQNGERRCETADVTSEPPRLAQAQDVFVEEAVRSLVNKKVSPSNVNDV